MSHSFMNVHKESRHKTTSVYYEIAIFFVKSFNFSIYWLTNLIYGICSESTFDYKEIF